MNPTPATAHANMAAPRARIDAPFVDHRHDAPTTAPLPQKEERLPFTVRVVRSAAELNKAVQIRHSAYARHVPEFAETLKAPEPQDSEPGVVVLLAESRVDGSPLGTARIQTNQHKPLAVEQSITLPDWLQDRRLAEVSRLGIANGAIGRLVKIVLIKACFQYCEAHGIEWAVVAGRAPIDRHYEQLLFQDVFPGQGFMPMRHANNLPHRVMAFEIASGHTRWSQAQHPLLAFFSHTRHPDIDLGPASTLPLQERARSPYHQDAPYLN